MSNRNNEGKRHPRKSPKVRGFFCAGKGEGGEGKSRKEQWERRTRKFRSQDGNTGSSIEEVTEDGG